MHKEKIFITAFGATTPLGNSWESIAYSLRNGISGIQEINKFDCSSYVTSTAGIPNEGNEEIRWPSKRPFYGEQFYTQRTVQRLLEHPNFPHDYYDSDGIGCFIGMDEPVFDMSIAQRIVNDHVNGKNALDRRHTSQLMTEYLRIQDFMSLQPSSILAEVHKQIAFGGTALGHMGLCSASLQAIGMGYQYLKNASLEAVIVGGVSGKVNPLNLARLEHMNVISTDTRLDGQKRSRPFDRKRSGFVLAEGAVFFLLEKECNLNTRRGTSLIEILGYGSSLGAQHIVAPHVQELEMVYCMERAIKDSGVSKDKIDHINAHGTSTVLNDMHESRAINKVFGDNHSIPVAANKSLHGHLIAAAGAMEVLNCIISSKEQFIPGTINLEDQDLECKIRVPRKSEDQKINVILKNSFGMGGLAASLLLGSEV